MAQYMLHGTLQATIFEATSLSNSTTKSVGAPELIRNAPTTFKRRLLRILSWIFCRPKLVEEIEESVGLGKGSAKLYATIDLEKARLGRTRVITKEPNNPRWYESFHIYCAHSATDVVFTIKADNPVGASLIGRAYLPVKDILDSNNGEEVDRWLDIYKEDRPMGGGAQIHVCLCYWDVSKDPYQSWDRGVASPSYPGVPHTFFPQRHGCKVTLYQDTHVPDDGLVPYRIPLASNHYYEPHRCWEDVFDAITNARHLIYVTGWSVYTKITLVRDPKRPRPDGDTTLGELLKRKAREGVRVLLLVWDDRTSLGLGPLRKDGVMATHDQDTASYFHGTGVHCIICPRNPDEGGSYVQGLETATMFTHHQKSMVMDVEEPGERMVIGRNNDGRRRRKRGIVSFIGGIDLCDGRYDTQYHSLFRTLGTVHHNDFHQPNFPGASIRKGGPREPWHDIHCRLEGPIAWDVLRNFEQRWKKQGAGAELLIQPENDLAIDGGPPTMEDDREAWSVQLFRSIDGGAAADFPEAPETAAAVGLITGKDHVIDRSIQDAYIHAIRRARYFIYIENQYFLGSSYGWKGKAADGIMVEDIGALHLIPKEISLKIISKIEAGEHFSVYVVIPMWPEGVPESGSVQAILDWQRRTMEMMYIDIAEALHAKGLQANPKDYLSFFCLGNREVNKGGEYRPMEHLEPDTDYIRAQQARRFMIYVHAKMMIVDDEYIIIGSANINQRSMDGGRDSEIAMGAYQPNYLATGQLAKGQIHDFRLALWYEHLGMLDDTFLQPESVECMRKVNKIAERNWRLYTSDMLVSDLPSHLLSYPLGVSEDGEIVELPGVEFFPDTKARVLGSKSDYLPPILTT